MAQLNIFELPVKPPPRKLPRAELILEPDPEPAAQPEPPKQTKGGGAPKPTAVIVSELKENGQDNEFYPTTPEIIRMVQKRLEKKDTSDTTGVYKYEVFEDILDVGAGDGRVLMQLTKGKRYAIEKSGVLVHQMDPSIFVVGSDLWENSIIDKKVDIVFSNPPYSQFVEWSIKLIMEANAKKLFLVLPERWSNNDKIQAALEDRDAKAEVLGSTDFLEADRKARAKVDIIYINLQAGRGRYSYGNEPNVNPFKLWVEKEFPRDQRTEDSAKAEKAAWKEQINELVPGRGLVPALVEMYQQELITLQNNFRVIAGLDQAIFEELHVDFNSMTNFLEDRIKGLKSKYWTELFDHFKPVTSRLTKDSREKLLNTLTENISVDFTESNCYAVATWAIKNANDFYDSQLITVFTGLANRANCIKYKSNQKTWERDEWRFNQDARNDNIGRYTLDYRCVISCYNTFTAERFNSYEYPNGLHKNTHTKLNDILVVASNLGFDCSWENSHNYEWEPGQTVDFCINGLSKKILMSVKAYKNGNVHIKFNQKFLRAFAVEFGRLKGWLRNAQEASDELNIPIKEATEYFKTNYSLEANGFKLLT